MHVVAARARTCLPLCPSYAPLVPVTVCPCQQGVFGAQGRAKLREEGRDLVKLRVCYSHEYVGSEHTQKAYAVEAGEACADLFQHALREGRKRDAKTSSTSLEALREAERKRLLKRAANKRQTGKVRFRKGGTTGPNKLVALVASVQLRTGKDELIH